MVAARVAQSVARPSWSFRRPPQPFVGAVKGLRFKVLRVQPGRNSFQAVILGEVRPNEDGAEVRVRVRLSWPVAAFLAAWMGFFFLGSLGLWDKAPDARVGVLFGGFAYLLMTASFWGDVNVVRGALCRALGCEDNPPLG